MGTNCGAPLLDNLYLFSYEYDFIMSLLEKKQLHLSRKFYCFYPYIDDLISFNNPELLTKILLKNFYPKKFGDKIKMTSSQNPFGNFKSKIPLNF